jgi:uncharacterized protein
MIILAISAALALEGAASAQSFNCNYAKAPDEVMICNSPTLSRLDEQMSVMYFQTRNSMSGVARAQLQNDQAAWLRGRQMCGGDRVASGRLTSGASGNCRTTSGRRRRGAVADHSVLS